MAEEGEESLEERAFKEWLMHPITIKLRLFARERREAIRDQWEHGNISDWVKDIHVLLNAAAIGECKSLAWIEELEWGDLEEGNDEPRKPDGNSEE